MSHDGGAGRPEAASKPAHAHDHDFRPPHAASGDPTAFWERRYENAGPIWSGRVNETLALIAGELVPGRSLDLGCGEGGDVIWLAQHGWQATGIDISSIAIARATAAAEAAEVSAEQIRFVVADLAAMGEQELAAMDLRGMDLVSASFLQSPVELPRATILQAAAGLVANGGHLVLISHAAAPAGARFGDGKAPVFPTPESELADLGLDEGSWQTLRAETLRRDSVTPEGEPTTHEDTLVVLRRLA